MRGNAAAALDHHQLQLEETLTNHPRREQPQLRIAPPAAPLPDDRARVARALLDRCAPIYPVLADQSLVHLGDDGAAVDELESDPRYLIGRLQQALTALLAQETPPLDATATLLAEAIEDAISYRERCCANCPPDGFCAKCAPSWRKAAEYEALWRELGLIGEIPRPRATLKPVTSLQPLHA